MRNLGLHHRPKLGFAIANTVQRLDAIAPYQGKVTEPVGSTRHNLTMDLT